MDEEDIMNIKPSGNNVKNKKILIGISATLLTIDSGSLLGRKRVAVGDDYVRAIVAAGGTPVILPVVAEPPCIEQMVHSIDALLLSGGYDVAPSFFGKEPLPGLEVTCPLRDRFEIALLQQAVKRKIPVFGICRGLQLINVALGGTLHQDIPSLLPGAVQHYQKSAPDEVSHTVKIKSKTLLEAILGKNELLTNTLHHQAIDKLAPGLIASAHTTDGLVEAFEWKKELFLIAVQWHPELLLTTYPIMQKLFDAFVSAARQKRQP